MKQDITIQIIAEHLEHRGLKTLLVSKSTTKSPYYRVILDEGREWCHNYADTLKKDCWVADMSRFIARYRMCKLKDELWIKAESLGIPVEERMVWVNNTMRERSEPISIS